MLLKEVVVVFVDFDAGLIRYSSLSNYSYNTLIICIES